MVKWEEKTAASQHQRKTPGYIESKIITELKGTPSIYQDEGTHIRKVLAK